MRIAVFISCLSLSLLLTACTEWPEPQGEAPVSTPVELDLGKRVAGIAQQQVGVPYVYGGHSPLGFDCSGLVYYSYGKAGVSLPRTAQAQYDHTQRVQRQDLQAGDLVFFFGGNAMHVGVYVGDGWFVHAPETGKPVGGAWLNTGYWSDHYYGAGRP